MDEFQNLFNQAVQIKNADMLSRRQMFEKQPSFIKAGLYYSVKYHSVRQQIFQQKIFSAELIKQTGNQLFKQNKFDQSIKQYEQALSIFRYIANKNKNWKNQGLFDEDLVYMDEEGSTKEEKTILRSLKLTLYQNLATSYIRNQSHQDAVCACDEALKIEPKTVKALYLRAKARTETINPSIEDFKFAITDLQQASFIDPKDQLIVEQLEKLKSRLNDMRTQEQQMYKKMFQKKGQNTLLDTGESQQQQTAPPADQPKPSGEEPAHAHSKPATSKTTHQGKSKASQAKAADQSNAHAYKHNTNESPQQLPGDKNSNKNPKEFWNIFNEKRDYDNFDYELNYEIDPNVEVPMEIIELGKYIENKGYDMVKLFEITGKVKEAQDLKDKLKKAMAAKNQLEKIAKLDFNRPTAKLQELAMSHQIDLNDESIKQEFRKIQNQNLQDIRQWLASNGHPLPENTQSAQSQAKATQSGAGSTFGKFDSKPPYIQQQPQQPQFFSSQGIKPSQGAGTQPFVINNNFYNQTYNTNNQVINNFYAEEEKRVKSKEGQKTHKQPATDSDSDIKIEDEDEDDEDEDAQGQGAKAASQPIQKQAQALKEQIQKASQADKGIKSQPGNCSLLNQLVILLCLGLLVFKIIYHFYSDTNTSSGAAMNMGRSSDALSSSLL